MKRLLNFSQYVLNEQDGEETEVNRPETEREAKSRIAASLVKTVFGDVSGLTGGIDSQIEITKEVKSGLPYSACGGSPFELNRTEHNLRFFKNVLKYLNDEKGRDHSRALKELEDGRSIVIGIRNKIDVKSKPENNDKFTDALYLIDQKAKDDDKFKPYQITTSPSLAYYGKKPLNPSGTGIKLPGDTLYNLENHTMGHGTYVLMAEAEPIEVGRYPVGTVKYETYKPAENFKKQHCGMQIHRSSTGAVSPCIGPWSAGCQVFCDIKEFDDFIARAKKQSINGTRFIYALIELDDLTGKKLEDFETSNPQIAKKEDSKISSEKIKDDEDKKAKQAEIDNLAAYIKRESDSYGETDEYSVIKKYNSVIASSKDFKKLKNTYYSKYRRNVYDDLDGFMDSTELGKLAYTV